MRKTITGILVIAILFLGITVNPYQSQAATIAFDAASSGDNSNLSSTLTFSHTVTGTNPVLACLVFVNTNSDVITGVTYAGVSMTKVDSLVNSDNNNFLYSFILGSPSTGTNNVVVTSSVNPSNIRAICQSYTGASGTPDAHATKSQTVTHGSTVSLSLTTVSDNDWVISFAGGAGDPPTVSSGVAIRKSVGNEVGGDSNALIHPPGSYSTVWVNGGISGSESVTILNIAIAPFTVPPSTCSYSGSGNWIVKYSDNCVITSTISIASGSKFNLVRDNTGSFKVTTGGLVQILGRAVVLRPGTNIVLNSTVNGAVFK